MSFLISVATHGHLTSILLLASWNHVYMQMLLCLQKYYISDISWREESLAQVYVRFIFRVFLLTTYVPKYIRCFGSTNCTPKTSNI
jgi:hypothetical protein